MVTATTNQNRTGLMLLDCDITSSSPTSSTTVAVGASRLLLLLKNGPNGDDLLLYINDYSLAAGSIKKHRDSKEFRYWHAKVFNSCGWPLQNMSQKKNKMKEKEREIENAKEREELWMEEIFVDWLCSSPSVCWVLVLLKFM